MTNTGEFQGLVVGTMCLTNQFFNNKFAEVMQFFQHQGPLMDHLLAVPDIPMPFVRKAAATAHARAYIGWM